MAAAGWLLDLPGGRLAAIGAGELVHLLPDLPTLVPVPGAPAHRARSFLWAGQAAPVLDMGAWLGGEGIADRGLLAVVGWRDPRSGEAAYGGVLLSAIPRRISVQDSQAAPSDELPGDWRSVAHSAFRLEGRVIPVLDLPHVFAAPAPGA